MATGTNPSPPSSSQLLPRPSKPTPSGVDYYFGELNFCLDPKDGALTGPSITKALNSATNSMLKNLLILNSPEDELPAAKEVQRLKEQFEADFSAQKEDSFYLAGRDYLECVCALGGEGCPEQQRLEALEPTFQVAFRRVAAVLADFGCEVTAGVAGRVRPGEKDICLSILDYATAEDTKTKALNAVSNRVVRTVCVGNDEDLRALAREMEAKRAGILTRWVGNGWKGSPEDTYYGSLVGLVQEGLTDAPPALVGPYANAYQRLVGIVVQEVGTGATPVSEKVLESFLTWERDLRKNLTEPAWEANPRDLVGSWSIGDALVWVGWDGRGKEEVQVEPGLAEPDTGLGGLVVTFKADGSVVVPPQTGVGLGWRLEPGPTHLDTIYFELLPAQATSAETGSGSGELLSYRGYVDRGARIEARFSGRPIKMTGRLSTLVNGQPRESTRFLMRLVRRGGGDDDVALPTAWIPW